jgi:hypothetical protein
MDIHPKLQGGSPAKFAFDSNATADQLYPFAYPAQTEVIVSFASNGIESNHLILHRKWFAITARRLREEERPFAFAQGRLRILRLTPSPTNLLKILVVRRAGVTGGRTTIDE